MDKETILDTYVFSHAFYTKDYENMSKLEKEVHNYINKKPIDISVLLEEYSKIGDKSTKEQFYLIPILILLINNVVNNMRTEL